MSRSFAILLGAALIMHMAGLVLLVWALITGDADRLRAGAKATLFGIVGAIAIMGLWRES